MSTPARKYDRTTLLTLPNKITIFRIVLIPTIVIGLLENWRITNALLIFTMLTDLLDGVVARMRGEQTLIGAFLDPMADKLLLTATFITLAYMGRLPMWVFVVIFSRDLLIVLGWGIIHILTGSSAIMPTALGKITTAFQMTLALSITLNTPANLQHVLVWVIVLITAISAVHYVLIGEKQLGANL